MRPFKRQSRLQQLLARVKDDLPGRLARVQESVLHPLRMRAVTAAGAVEEALAFNEVSFPPSSAGLH